MPVFIEIIISGLG